MVNGKFRSRWALKQFRQVKGHEADVSLHRLPTFCISEGWYGHVIAFFHPI